MLRILHITDFHLAPKTEKDWNNFLKGALMRKLESLHKMKSIDIVAFTGDMIDIGGKEYGGAPAAFKVFQQEVIQPILDTLGLDRNRFLMSPGNHDIVRNLDPEFANIGLIKLFDNREKGLKFMRDAHKANDYNGFKRIKDYKDFENSFYKGTTGTQISMFSSSFKLKIKNFNIGICCLNSAWRCYDSEDKNRLIIGDEELATHYRYIKDCDAKIVLMHHPLDWLAEIERKTIFQHITKDFEILLVGHMHETLTTSHTGFNGTLFINMAPSGLNNIRSDSRDYSNGFSILDFSSDKKDKKSIDVSYFRYNHGKKEFVINTDEGEEGLLSFDFPTTRTTNKVAIINNLLEHIKEDHFLKMDEHMLEVKAQASNLGIKELFVMPPINDGNAHEQDEVPEINLTLNDLIKIQSDFMIFGKQESGKTTLLYRLVRSYVDEFDFIEKIPVYIDFEEIRNKELTTVIKEYLRCSSEEAKYLLLADLVVFLIDNLNYKSERNNTEQLKKINKFKEQYPKIKIIATGECEMAGILEKEYIELCEIPFETFYIRSLKSKEIQSLLKLWIPNETAFQSGDRLDKLITNFQSFGLPSTAMSVSLFLWSMENKDRKPINHAVLLEIYIEIILEKISKFNIYRENFDFTNKVQLLAKIASEMLLADDSGEGYSLEYSKFSEIIDKYIHEEVGFPYDPQIIISYFLDRKLFTKYQGSRIKFTYSAFFHFFIAKRMEFDPSFREHIMKKEHYFLYFKEIDYYTALTRSDKEIFKEILKRFEEEFEKTDEVLTNVNVDEYFTQQRKNAEEAAKNLDIKSIQSNRPSEEVISKYQDRRLKEIPDPNKILKKQGKKNLEAMLIMMANVLRNSEGIEDFSLKKHAYNSLIKYSLVWTVGYCEYLKDFIVKNKKFPISLPSELNVDVYMKSIPYFTQFGMYYHGGSAKLAPIILDKMNEDKTGKGITNSDLEEYFSVAMYADIEGKDFQKHLKDFAKRVRGNIVRDYLLFKVIYYYYRRTEPGSPMEDVYLDILSEIRIRAQKLPQRFKQTIIKELKKGKATFERKTGLGSGKIDYT
jgi:predicted MPP superfamily phosphohydrolase